MAVTGGADFDEDLAGTGRGDGYGHEMVFESADSVSFSP